MLHPTRNPVIWPGTTFATGVQRALWSILLLSALLLCAVQWIPAHAAEPAALVKDINPAIGPQPYPNWSLNNLTRVGDMLYFVGDGGGTGQELWKSDGTRTGTVMVKDINPGPNGS